VSKPGQASKLHGVSESRACDSSVCWSSNKPKNTKTAKVVMLVDALSRVSCNSIIQAVQGGLSLDAHSDAPIKHKIICPCRVSGKLQLYRRSKIAGDEQWYHRGSVSSLVAGGANGQKVGCLTFKLDVAGMCLPCLWSLASCLWSPVSISPRT